MLQRCMMCRLWSHLRNINFARALLENQRPLNTVSGQHGLLRDLMGRWYIRALESRSCDLDQLLAMLQDLQRPPSGYTVMHCPRIERSAEVDTSWYVWFFPNVRHSLLIPLFAHRVS